MYFLKKIKFVLNLHNQYYITECYFLFQNTSISLSNNQQHNSNWYES